MTPGFESSHMARALAEAEAAAKRSVWPTIQAVSTPPPLQP